MNTSLNCPSSQDAPRVPKPSTRKLEAAASEGKVANDGSSQDPPMSSMFDQGTTAECKEEVVSAELSVLIDGKEVTALVDTGADF